MDRPDLTLAAVLSLLIQHLYQGQMGINMEGAVGALTGESAGLRKAVTVRHRAAEGVFNGFSLMLQHRLCVRHHPPWADPAFTVPQTPIGKEEEAGGVTGELAGR